MKGFVGVTDNDWFAFLSHQLGIDEVNFWQSDVNNNWFAMSFIELVFLFIMYFFWFKAGI